MAVTYSSQYERMTKAPVSGLVIKLGIPTTISMLVTSLYNMVDTMFVGKLGTSASGAVGIVFGFMAILQAFGFMYGQGSGILISRLLGQKDEKSASKIASTGFFLCLVTAVVIAVIALIYLEPLMYLLGSTDTILPYAKTYVFYIILAAPFMTCCFVLNNIIRYEGKATFAMVGLLAGAVLNMVGDPIFMFVFDMGIAGAGVSTALSQFVSFCILLSVFLMGKTESRISIKYITHSFKDVWDIVTTGFPGLVRQGLGSLSTMLLNQHARVYGDAAVAAMSIVNRLSMFIFSVGLGVGQGFQPVCGFNYGAKKFSRVRKAFIFTVIVSEVLMASFAIVGLIFPEQAITFFRDDPEVIAFGIPALRFQCLALFLQPLAVLTNMTLQSTGQRMSATIVSMLRSGLYFIPTLLIATHIGGATGVQISQPIADALTFLTVIPFAANFILKLPKDVSL